MKPWIALGAFFAAAILWMALDRKVPRKAFVPYSAYNTSGEGLSLAFEYLRASTLARPIERAYLDPRGVVFRIAPDSDVPPGLRKPTSKG
ncbi:MAG: hypothetical protein HYY16_13780 [Planctomycetes bacterium]|nr:hypothetical protein [Planctomycetota bacterium]